MENILFVATTQKMGDVASRLISKMNLNIPVVVSSEFEADKIVKKYPHIEVFISRGRTAETIENLSQKPAIGITCSINDVLDPVRRLNSKGSEKIAVLGSPALIGSNSCDYKINNVDILMRPYETNQLEGIVKKLHDEGVTGAVIGASASKVTEKYGMLVEPLDTEAASVERAIIDAVKIAKAQENERLKEKERADTIHGYSSELYAAIEQVAAAVQELAASSQELASTSQETANIAGKAFEEVQNTSAILDIIRRVAKQTNLLGLNAAIEASKAGENGRGFSVVAVEVRKLADESNKSAHNIDDMLNKFRGSVKSVLTNVEQSNLITQEQAKANQNIAEMLDNLREISMKLKNMAEKN